MTFNCDDCEYQNAKRIGLDTHVRQKHRRALAPTSTPKKLRDYPFPSTWEPSTSLPVSPVREKARQAEYWNCGADPPLTTKSWARAKGPFYYIFPKRPKRQRHF